MKKFRLKGILPPGRIHDQRRGLIDLAEVSDATAAELWKEGCPFIEPLPDGRKMMFPEEKSIEIEPLQEPTPPKRKK